MGEPYCDYDMIVIGTGKVGLTAGFRSLEFGSLVLVLEKGVDSHHRAASYP